MTTTLDPITTYCLLCNQRSHACTCNLMDDQSEQYSASHVQPSIPEGARVNRVVERNSSILDAAAKHQAESREWKALWLAEVMRGDHGFEETYTVSELDRARERIDGWSKTKDSRGNITAEYQS